MSDGKPFSTTEYQIRVGGYPVSYPYCIDKDALQEFAEICKNNPDSFVDIVRVNTEIVMGKFEYNQMKRHFVGIGRRVNSSANGEEE